MLLARTLIFVKLTNSICVEEFEIKVGGTIAEALKVEGIEHAIAEIFYFLNRLLYFSAITFQGISGL